MFLKNKVLHVFVSLLSCDLILSSDHDYSSQNVDFSVYVLLTGVT